jgi:hypothetical protein
MPSIISNPSKKIPEVKPIPVVESTNLSFPFGKPYGPKVFGSLMSKLTGYPQKREFDIRPPGEGLPRVIHYCADQSGCAFWRMIWPGDELLAHNKAVIMTLYQMVTDANFYRGIDAVKLQRQCTDIQRDFVKFLRDVSNQLKEKTGKGFRIIYEVDDVLMRSHLAEAAYNVCGDSFQDPKIEIIVKEILDLSDEFTVPSEKMRHLYEDHFDYHKISVLPNYLPKGLFDIGYDRNKLTQRYYKHKAKPRILYAGSGTHFDVANKVNQKDDFGHVVDAIAQDILIHKKYEWVFFGALPLKLRQFIGSGIEFHQWCAISEYPQKLKELNVNACIAPLADNEFSRSKANIKLTESGSQGIPCIAQNLDCYNFDGWKYLFNTSEEMFKMLADVFKSESAYLEASDFAKKYSEQYFIQDHLDEYNLIYTTDYGDKSRMNNASFVKNNPQQFV